MHRGKETVKAVLTPEEIEQIEEFGRCDSCGHLVVFHNEYHSKWCCDVADCPCEDWNP